jgi:hypothetical protein
MRCTTSLSAWVIAASPKAREAVQGGVVRDGPQFAVFHEPGFGFAIGPVLVAHQTQDGQHLRLRELVLAETAAIARHASVKATLWNAQTRYPPGILPSSRFSAACQASLRSCSKRLLTIALQLGLLRWRHANLSGVANGHGMSDWTE